MQELNESPVFAVSKEVKEDALKAIQSGIQQLYFQLDFVKKQYTDLPDLPEDASEEQKQERAKRRVQIDAMEKKVEDQIEFYNFCKASV
jgi:phage shock protein A